MRYEVVLYINSRHSLFDYAKIYTGLDALARRGLIGLRVRTGEEFPTKLMLADVTAPDAKSRRLLGFDLYDRSTFLCSAGLERCDLYFKRSLYRPHTTVLPLEQRAKIVPFGLNYPCASGGSRLWVLRTWSWGVGKTICRSPRESAHRLRGWLREYRRYVTLRDFACFEQRPEIPVEPVVVFQTRVWEPEGPSAELEQINEERVALIRVLRTALGARFRGGLVPSAFARRHYPDVVLSYGYRQEDYVKVLQRYLIAIGTRGLHDSIAFKLPEYLAASMCVVSEPLRHELPHRLEPGRHYLEFRSHDECITQCEWLLSNPDAAREMRRHNFAYYRQWVAPAEHLLDCLERIPA